MELDGAMTVVSYSGARMDRQHGVGWRNDCSENMIRQLRIPIRIVIEEQWRNNHGADGARARPPAGAPLPRAETYFFRQRVLV